MLRLILRCQALFYALTGLWPQVSLASFEYVTGPKTDDWLVRTVGLLAISIAAVLWVGSRHRRVPPDRAIVLLGGLAAASFAGIELAYGLSGRIAPLYLADAALELCFLTALVLAATLGWSRERPGF